MWWALWHGERSRLQPAAWQPPCSLLAAVHPATSVFESLAFVRPCNTKGQLQIASRACLFPFSPPPCRAAPEMLWGERCTEKADIYSYGIVSGMPTVCLLACLLVTLRRHEPPKAQVRHFYLSLTWALHIMPACRVPGLVWGRAAITCRSGQVLLGLCIVGFLSPAAAAAGAGAVGDCQRGEAGARAAEGPEVCVVTGLLCWGHSQGWSQ